MFDLMFRHPVLFTTVLGFCSAMAGYWYLRAGFSRKGYAGFTAAFWGAAFVLVAMVVTGRSPELGGVFVAFMCGAIIFPVLVGLLVAALAWTARSAVASTDPRRKD